MGGRSFPSPPETISQLLAVYRLPLTADRSRPPGRPDPVDAVVARVRPAAAIPVAREEIEKSVGPLDHVPQAAEPALSCGKCRYCREGNPNLCLHLLREELRRAQKAGASGDAVRDAQALIQEAVDKVLASPDDTRLAGQYKQRLVDAIVRLRAR